MSRTAALLLAAKAIETAAPSAPVRILAPVGSLSGRRQRRSRRPLNHVANSLFIVSSDLHDKMNVHTICETLVAAGILLPA